MRRPLPPDAGVDTLEQAFYEALQRGDVDALMACWVDEDEPVCIHPGGARLCGLPAVRDAFALMFERGGVSLRAEVVHRASVGNTVVHSVVETVDVPTDDGLIQASVWATNVYVATPQGWRLLAHHASPGPQQREVERRPPASQLLH